MTTVLEWVEAISCKSCNTREMSSFLVKGKLKKGCSGFVNGVMTMMEGKVHFIAHMAQTKWIECAV